MDQLPNVQKVSKPGYSIISEYPVNQELKFLKNNKRSVGKEVGNSKILGQLI